MSEPIDHGEPWVQTLERESEHHHRPSAAIRDKSSQHVVCPNWFNRLDDLARAVACVNALAGVDLDNLDEIQQIALAVLTRKEPAAGLVDRMLEEHGGEFPGKANLEAKVRELEMRIAHLQVQLANALSALTRRVPPPNEEQPREWVRRSHRPPPTVTFSNRTRRDNG